ncbi:MAG: hypothetical protein V4773_16970 [Verrucomicrobiota bacterium]
MGYAISWIALRSKTPEAAARLLGLKPTGRTEQIAESPFSGLQLETGWYVVVLQGCEHPLVQHASLQQVSADAEALAVWLEEHVMACSAQYWKNGGQVWAVTHEAEGMEDELVEEGPLPAPYAEIKQRLLAEQQTADGVDYLFNIPLELAESVTGFMHDKAIAGHFDILEPGTLPRSGGLLSRLFGKK